MAEPRRVNFVQGRSGGGGAPLDDSEEESQSIWDRPFFTADLCESLITHHAVAYAEYAANFSGFLESLLAKTFPEPAIRTGIVKAMQALERSENIFKRRQAHIAWHIPFHLSRICDEIGKQLHASSVGDIHVFPCIAGLHGLAVVTQDRPGMFTCGVVNVAPTASEYHPYSSERHPKLLMQTVLEIKNIPKAKITSEAFWACNLLSETAHDQAVYTHILPWLNGKTYRDIVDDSQENSFSTGTKCDGGNMWKCFVHAFKYILRSLKVSDVHIKSTRLLLKQRMLAVCRHDLRKLSAIPHSVRLVIRTAVNNVALALARNGGHLSAEEFDATRALVDDVHKTLEDLPCPDEDTTKPPPALNLTQGWDRAPSLDAWPLASCLRRFDNVDDFIGQANEMPRYVPVNLLRVAGQVQTFDEGLRMLDEVVGLCNRIINQRVVKNGPFLILSLLTSVCTEILPTPLGPKTRAAKQAAGEPGCIWTSPMLYGQQLHCMQRVWECCEFFMWASFAIKTQKEFDAQRIITLGVLASIGDAVLRNCATDHPSVISQHLRGFKRKPGFAVTIGKLASQTENSITIAPALTFARAAVLDYHAELAEEYPAMNHMWAWEDGNALCKATMQFFRQIAQAEGLRMSHVINYFVGESEGYDAAVVKFWTEFRYHRNLYLCYKWMMAPKSKLPTCQNCTTCRVEPPVVRVDPGSFRFAFRYMHKELTGKAQQLRFPSFAIPSKFTAPWEAFTEDDLLHIKNLPTFDECLGQRDSELLLSYLTAPYIRIPLILNFFATEDRVSCLANTTIRSLLEASLFEPGKFLPRSLQEKIPQQVPSEDSNLLATPYGLLWNELQFSALGVTGPLLQLVALAREMDAGTVYNTSVVEIILFLMRIVARVNNYLVAANRAAQQPDSALSRRRGLRFADDQRNELARASESLQNLIETQLLPMLEAWNVEVMNNISANAEDIDDIDEATRLSANVQAHILLLSRSLPIDNANTVSLILSSAMFLTTRHTFNQESLPIPETELYDVLQAHRRPISQWLYRQSVKEIAFVMDSVVRIATSTGKRTSGDAFLWGYVSGKDCIGRFTRVDDDTTHRPDHDSLRPFLVDSVSSCVGIPQLKDGVTCIDEGQQDVEINLHTYSLTFKAAHLVALPYDVAANADVQLVFGRKGNRNAAMVQSMQCAVIQDAVNRQWVRLVGQEHDIQFWRTGDPRIPLPVDGCRFLPDDMAPSEDWILKLVEPVRRAFFTRSFWQPPIFIMLPEHTLKAEQNTAVLGAVCSSTGKLLKEIVVLRDLSTVLVYDVFSIGRRFYRSLVYSTNAHFALQELEMSVADRRHAWAPWERHAGGSFDADSSPEPATSAVILRHATHPENKSKALETFIPSRVLQGIIPQALLQTHEFWQDPDDNIRGYPLDKDALSLLWIHWKDIDYEAIGTKETCLQVFRFARAAEAPKVSEKAILKSQKLQVADETEDELERMRTASTDATDFIDEGMFRQASTIAQKTESATTEDLNLMLVNLINAKKGTPLHSVAMVFSRIELLSHVLCWTTQVDYDSTVGGAVTLDLVSLPRLKLSFSAHADADGNLQLFSLDHAHLFVSNTRLDRVTTLLQGIPHSLILSDVNRNISVLVPALHVVRPKIDTASFSTELVVNRSNVDWYQKLDTKYYLYPVHVSLSFLFTPTLASALYLIALRFLHCEYADVFQLASTIGTDVEFTPEEQQNFLLLGTRDDRPEAAACFAKIGLLVADSPVTLCWSLPEKTACMIRSSSTIGLHCKLSESEERRLLHICGVLLKKLDIVDDVADKEKSDLMNTITNRISRHVSVLEYSSPSERKQIEDVYRKIARRVRDDLDIRITREEISRLLLTWMSYTKLPVFLRCILENRQAILDAEAKALESGNPENATLRVPPLGKDELWSFYSDYAPLTVKIPEAQQKVMNREGRAMKLSPLFDFFYCGSAVRKPGMCECHECSETCGPDQGCPCSACKAKNKEELSKLRYIPERVPQRSSRIVSFYDIFSLVTTIFSRDSDAREQYTLVRPELRAWNNSLRRFTMREETNGFLQYYEMMSGTTKVRIGSGDCAKDLPSLLFPLLYEARRPECALGHLMHYLINNPQVWSKLPKYNRTSKNSFESRMSQIYTGIMQQAAQNAKPVPPPPVYEDRVDKQEVSVTPRPEVRETPFTPIGTTRILPILANTDCAEREWGLYNEHDLVVQGTEQIALPDDIRQALVGQPLRSVVPDGLLVFLNRAEQGVAPIDEDMPFDLTKHTAASTTVAKNMIRRLAQDMKDFADQENSTKFPRLQGLHHEKIVVAAVSEASGESLQQMIKTLTHLHETLTKMRDADALFVTHAFAVAERTANFMQQDHKRGQHAPVHSETHFAEAVMHLRRLANQEAHLSLAYLISCVTCTSAEQHWMQLNPFLTVPQCHSILNLIVTALLRTNRVGHVNRASESVKELLSLLQKAKSLTAAAVEDDHIRNAREALCASITQKADSLAGILATKRVYIDPTTFKYDPRFLIFEFTWNLTLRGRQRALLEEIYGSIMNNKSIVKQMIMGAGKTTVVGPILALMLADSKNLVIQVVPPALLDFTRSILRATFSCIIQKQIFCFNCDRASEVDSEVLTKFRHAKQSRGIVVTTPSSIKSIFLKFIEGLDRIEDTSRPPIENIEREVCDLQKVLSLWNRDAILVMDEVDMLLHPLKSELNFPIGEKHALDFAPTRWRLPIHLIDALFYFHSRRISVPLKDSPEAHALLQKIRDVIKKGLDVNALQSTPHLTLLNPDFYETEMKLPMAQWLLLFIKSHHFAGLSDDDTLYYITKRPGEKQDPGLNARVSVLEPEHIKTLNLAYEWLTAFLPHVLQKIDRVTFGIMNAADMKRAREEHPKMPRSRYVTSIPFIGKDLPSQSSEFAHPDVVIGLTVLAYRYEGLRRTDYADIMHAVHQAVEKEVGRFHLRRTNVLYTKWVQASGGRILSSFAYGEKKASTNDEELGMQPSESFVASPSHVGDEFAREGSTTLANLKGQLDVLPLKLMRQANSDEADKVYKLFRRTAEVIHWYLCEKIFPEYMTHQRRKLSASGQELGGNIMFQRRIGFSGTPSDLLPYELGKCDYEPGTDGKLIFTLTSPQVMSYRVADPGWTVRSLLDDIATASPPFHALIDTGALITGMSNLQVAQYLLKRGLPQMEGIVFLDEFDRKMILVRATGRVLKLAECGIPKVKRFAFYDQVHTTGMDIDHTPNAVAVQTLGKDMTFRDFSQGAYRMRGIAQGQRVHLLIIPEVYDLVLRTVKVLRAAGEVATAAGTLHDVSAWLLVNSIRSEHCQHNQLCIQTICNVWRKSAYKELLAANEKNIFQRGGSYPARVLGALSVFREPVDYSVPTFVPQPRMFSEAIGSYVSNFGDFINDEEGKVVVQGIVDMTTREDEVDNPVIDVQMVQEQEEEREITEEREKEQEIEMEKFVDLAYSRDEELSTPWALSSLRSLQRSVQFYSLNNFHLYKRKPITFPDNVMISRNFFNPKWSGFRRIKNVIISMEWVPDCQDLHEAPQPRCDFGDVDMDVALQKLAVTLSMATTHQGGLTEALLKDLVTIALGNPDAMQQVDWSVLAKVKTAEELRELLASNFMRGEQSGRYVVGLSLAEAETIRRVIHSRRLAQSSFLPDSPNTQVCLTIVPSSNVVLDSTQGFRDAVTSFQRERAYQVLRFFDSDLHYTEAGVNLLLRSLSSTPARQRQAFFLQLIQCRRRARQRWEKTPVSLLFSLPDPFTLLHQRTVGLCMRRDFEAKDLHLADAYLAINSSHSGVLTPDELWGAMRFTGLNDVTAADVLDFIEVADTHHEGTIQYTDFLAMLIGSREIDDEEGARGEGGPNKDDLQGKKLPTVPAYGAIELKDLRLAREKTRREEEDEANRAQASEDSRVRGEIEHEHMMEELALIQTSLNPKLLESALDFDFKQRVRPKLLQCFGNVSTYVPEEAFSMRHFVVPCNSGLQTQLRSLKLITNGTHLASYMLSLEFCIPKIKTVQGKDFKLGALEILENNSERMELFSVPTNAWEHTYSYNPSSMGGEDDEDEAGEGEDEDYDDYGSDYTSDEDDDDDDCGDDYRMYVYSEPTEEKKHRLKAVPYERRVVEDVGHRLSNTIRGRAVEWMKLSEPVVGFVPFEIGNRRYWDAERLIVQLCSDGTLAVTATTARPPEIPLTVFEDADAADDDDEGDDRSSSASSWGRWFEDFDDAGMVEEDEEEEDEQFDMGDLTDLVAAIKKAKELKAGDKVTRNPECWEGRGNEDGGVGSVGKVVRAEENRVHVQWPNGSKNHYKWGEAGLFELIKVSGDGDDDDDAGGRDAQNDTKWSNLLRTSNHGLRCGNCNNHIQSSNDAADAWYRCNNCANYNLCRKCFKNFEHVEHEFTNMMELMESMKTTEIVRGSHVRIRPDLKEPAFGWQDAPRNGTPGEVHELDVELGSIQVSFHDEIWYGKLSEVVLVDIKAEEMANMWLGLVVNEGGYPKKAIRNLFVVVDQQMSPPVIEGKFKVGQKVKAPYNSRYYPGEVRALLHNSKYIVAFDNVNAIGEGIDESEIFPNSFVKGIRVSIKRKERDQFYYGLQKGIECGMIGEVTNILNHSYGSKDLRVMVRFRNGTKVVTCTFMDSELDIVGEAKWFTVKRAPAPAAASSGVPSGAATPAGSPAAAAPPAELDATLGVQVPLPKSALPIVERAFSDGVATADVYLRDGSYEVDFATMTVIHPKSREVIADVVRDPPQQWVKQREKIRFDDGKWHVVSLVVKGDDAIVAFCDGMPLTVDYEGPDNNDENDEENEEESEEGEEDDESGSSGSNDEEEDEKDEEASENEKTGVRREDTVFESLCRSAAGKVVEELLKTRPTNEEGVQNLILDVLQREHERTEQECNVDYAARLNVPGLFAELVRVLLQDQPEDGPSIEETLLNTLQQIMEQDGEKEVDDEEGEEEEGEEEDDDDDDDDEEVPPPRKKATAAKPVSKVADSTKSDEDDEEWEDVEEGEDDDDDNDSAATEEEQEGEDDDDNDDEKSGDEEAEQKESPEEGDDDDEEEEEDGVEGKAVTTRSMPRQATAEDEEEDEEEDSDDEENDSMRLPRLKRTAAQVLALDVRNPLSVLMLAGNPLSNAERQRLGPSCPKRFVARMSLHWGAEEVSAEGAAKYFEAVDGESYWICPGCAQQNSRLKDQCTACQRDRVEDVDPNKQRKLKVKAVMPKSKDAQEVRKKMHARLRSQYQKQLEQIDNEWSNMNVT